VNTTERAALSFGILSGELVGATFVWLDASLGWWIGLIGAQVVITVLRMRF
jgi:hypothetical protein